MQTREKTQADHIDIPAGRRRVFSGIQPSGEVQLGNYLGAIKGWAARQAEAIARVIHRRMSIIVSNLPEAL